jgi:hypothetical protein
MSPAVSLNSETMPSAITGRGKLDRAPADGEASGEINSGMS